ncbi:Major facilitator superfamily domain-containing protein 6 [Stylophora pistillata]|uniref:Major facilitator superfamily domain-containing protein 6 n=1 Tax=Stylophora pistillata TaxID=50429 RepID=A0A2B4SAE9_STYPI|nr:Major facilitator superfamily domain-containing protein 6 [Stylophora pistillata]
MDKGRWLSKAFYTSFYVAIGALFPYLPVYFKQLRLSSHQNGILIGIRPLIQFCVTPLWGACADRFCKSKGIFLMSVLGWLVSNFLLSLVPTTDEPGRCELYNNNNSKYNTYNDGDNREISLPKSHTSSLKFTRNFSYSKMVTHQHTRKYDFYSRVSPYLDTTVPFFPITFRDLKDVCNVTIHNHDKEEEGLRINNDLKDQTEVASSEHSAQKPPQDFTSALATGVEYVECDSKEFLFLLLVTIIGTAIAAPAQAFADTVTLQSLNGETHKYGRVRLWGSLGWGIGGFSVGAAVSANYHTNQCGETVIDYMPCFYVYAAAMSVAFVCATQFQFDQPFVKEEQEVNVVDGSKTQKILQGLKSEIG